MTVRQDKLRELVERYRAIRTRDDWYNARRALQRFLREASPDEAIIARLEAEALVMAGVAIGMTLDEMFDLTSAGA